ncbi:MAG: YceI family protein [Metallibacterium scheffleri]|jgi:polyisoprenoid-binding protein YceI|uniref:YceI family protein n=1 Tax=Metallibacterium scheffleri TaxID=993689 RepID=UPI0026EA272E|nr:YceI family protein [Metallibacterium scheffleri]MCK9367850.1 YceI family protein [Metallibacterium scheffleri]
MKPLRGWLLLVLCCGVALPTSSAAALLQVDAARSHVEFGVRVLWFGKVIGVLDKLSGRVHALGAGRVQVDLRVDARALRMQSRDYQRFASGPEFFDSAQYPRIDFRSAPFALATLVSGGTVDGAVTLRGITRNVVFTVLPQPCAALAALQDADAPADSGSSMRSATSGGGAAAATSAASAVMAVAPAVPGSIAVPAVATSTAADAAAAAVPRDSCRVLARGNIRRSDFGMRGHSFTIADRIELGLVLRLRRVDVTHDAARARGASVLSPAAAASVANPAAVSSSTPPPR